ncbi:MAG: D-sedoheptulose 7-phosphate isomerase [Candidatus Marinimicrobia bacterium]|jgi:D-sedoheptulose 7-phosphate isomerase|nr:D-sedoheptulose 7-phosphate isomerase [Candidatus Neomarinimicrobiota bacterium]
MIDKIEIIKNHLLESLNVKNRILEDNKLVVKIAEASDLIINSVNKGGKVMWCGNGGSAADAQHLSAELIARLNFNRKPIASIALTTDTSFLTAWSNDIDFSSIFSRQVEGLGRSDDVLIGISTSGNSKNILEAIKSANEKNIKTIAFLGKDGGKIKSHADISIVVPSENTQHIQESHITIGHIICDIIERKLFS